MALGTTLTTLGGPTVLLELGGVRLLTAPTFDEPGEYPVGTRALRTTAPSTLSAAEVGRVDAVLLSHDQHADNLDHGGREFLAGSPRTARGRSGPAAGATSPADRGRTVDVHAMRTTFGTLLSRTGAAPRTAQAAGRGWRHIRFVATALDRIDAILAVDGIDAVFIGPSDLSIGLSRGSALDPDGAEVSAAINHALARAKAAGKFAGIYAPDGERGADYTKRGYHFVSIASDLGFMMAGAASVMKIATA